MRVYHHGHEIDFGFESHSAVAICRTCERDLTDAEIDSEYPRRSYDKAPLTVSELLFSAKAQVASKLRTDYDPRRDGVRLTPEVVVEICEHILAERSNIPNEV